MQDDKKDVSVQTNPITIFYLRDTADTIKKLLNRPIDINVLRITKDVTVDVEEYIIDKLLDNKIMVHKTIVLNEWVKQPFAHMSQFSVTDGNLICSISRYYHLIEEKCKTDNSLMFYFNEINFAFIEIINNRSKYFNIFNKLIHKEYFSLAHGFALFTVWITTVLREQIAGYVLDFIVLLYLSVNFKNNADDVSRYFINNYLLSDSFPDTNNVMLLFKIWFEDKCEFYIDPTELIRYLTMFLNGINFAHLETK